MENLEIIMESYYSALYWKAFFYGMLIPSLIYVLFTYLTHRMMKRHFENFELQIKAAYNELLIKDLESEVAFLKEMSDTINADKSDDS
tara:strand:- start:972 stop:1235 length:264 start_codon:yes stop_codon:yes gene_type:complete